jgi:hypothetical protein
MDQWEYWPTYIEASATKTEIKEFLKSKVPGLKKPAKFMAESMMPQLNEMGAQGWELVHMEPVPALGKRGDVLFGSREWSNVYFCVFKRRLPGSSQPVTPLNAAGQPAFPSPAPRPATPQPQDYEPRPPQKIVQQKPENT